MCHWGANQSRQGACGCVVQAVSGLSAEVYVAGFPLPIVAYPLQAMVTQPVKPFLDPM